MCGSLPINTSVTDFTKRHLVRGNKTFILNIIKLFSVISYSQTIIEVVEYIITIGQLVFL